MRLKVNSYQWNDMSMCLVLIFLFLRLHPVFVSDVVSVYLFDVIIIIIIFCSGRLKISYAERDIVVLLVGILMLKILLMKCDLDMILSILKIFYYMIFYSFINNKISDPLKFEQFKRICKVCFWIMFWIALIQFLQIPVISNLVYTLYGEHKLRSLWSGNPRIYSTFYNANWYAVFVAGYTVIFCGEYFKNRNIKKFMFNISATCMLIIISGSRTGLIALLIGVFSYLFFNKEIKQIICLIAGVILVLSVMFLVGSKSAFFFRTFRRYTYLTQILSTLGQGNEIEKLSDSRWLFWNEGWKIFMDSPFVGNKIGDCIPHNSYISFLISFGLIGTLLIMPFLFLFIGKYVSKKNNGIQRANSIALFCMYGVIMLSGDYLFSTQIMLSIIVLFCLGTGYMEPIRIVNPNLSLYRNNRRN